MVEIEAPKIEDDPWLAAAGEAMMFGTAWVRTRIVDGIVVTERVDCWANPPVNGGKVNMPCSVSDEEIAYYEREHNRRSYGVDWTDARLTVEVACVLAKVIRANGLESSLPGYALGWIAAHEARDARR